MNGLDHPIFYAAFMLVVGLGIPVFAALNGNLGARLQNPVLAAIIALSAALGSCFCRGKFLIWLWRVQFHFIPIWAGCLLSSMYWV